MKNFEQINLGYNNIFQPNKLSIGLVVPIENYSHSTVPTMTHHVERVLQIETLGFKAIWVRDIPFHIPSFGDAGQTFDPFTYLGYLAAKTSSITLATGSIALPLHHPVHIAKSAATIDQLSGGRLVLGVASGDRYEEYPGMGIDYEKRGELFKESFEYIRKAQEHRPSFEFKHYGHSQLNTGILPKATAHKLPLLVTGYSQQSLQWNAENADGWMYYPRDLQTQKRMIDEWRSLIPEDQTNKPFMQPLYVVLQDDDDFKPEPIQLGYKIGANHLIEYFHQIKENGVNHVGINLRFNTQNMDRTLENIAKKVLPHFH